MKTDLAVPAGKVVGIGKIKIFCTNDFPYEIPTLSVIVAKTNKGDFVSTCIQLLLDADGETPRSSMEKLKSHILDYLKTLFSDDFKETAWDMLHNTFNDDFANPYWKVYRDFQLDLAENGIPTDSKSAMIELIAKLEKQIADLRSVIDNGKSDFEAKIVDYQEPAA